MQDSPLHSEERARLSITGGDTVDWLPHSCVQVVVIPITAAYVKEFGEVVGGFPC
jgi:hypothetical protein